MEWISNSLLVYLDDKVVGTFVSSWSQPDRHALIITHSAKATLIMVGPLLRCSKSSFYTLLVDKKHYYRLHLIPNFVIDFR